MRFTILTAINYLGGGGGGGIKSIYEILLNVDFLSLHLTVTVLTPQKRYLNGPSRLRKKKTSNVYWGSVSIIQSDSYPGHSCRLFSDWVGLSYSL